MKSKRLDNLFSLPHCRSLRTVDLDGVGIDDPIGAYMSDR